MTTNIFNHDISNAAKIRVLIFVLVASAIGFTLNLFPIFLFSDLTLIFGPAMSLLVALSIGPWWGALTAAIVSVSLIYSWEHYYAFLLFVPEAFVVGVLYRKGWNELFAGFVFWLIVAIPFVLVLVFHRSQHDLALDLTGKYFINSFLYTLTASALLWFLSIPKWLHVEAVRSYTLRNQIFIILMVAMSIPLVTISFYQLDLEQSRLLTQTNQQLQTNVRRVTQGFDRLLKENQLAVYYQAKVLALSPVESLSSESELNQFHQQNPQFISMILAAPDGQLLAFSSLASATEKSKLANPVGRSIGDRNYFKGAMEKQTFISNAFRGRAKGDPIVTISTPIISPKNGEIIGVLAGSLNLYRFEDSIVDHNPSSQRAKHQLLVLDQKNKVVHFSSDIKVEMLQEIEWQLKTSSVNSSFFESPLYEQPFISFGETSAYGWSVYALYPLSEFNFLSQNNYRQYALVLIIIILFVMLLAVFLSFQVNSPVQWLFRRIVDFNVTKEDHEPISLSPLIPQEMVSLIKAHESAEKRLRYAFKTEQKQLEQRMQAEKSNAAKSNFLSAMSHELRTPLNAISGFGQLLALDETIEAESHKLINEINIASQHLMLLINDVLDMSKIESGQLTLKQEGVDVKSLLEETIPLIENQAKAREISIQLEPSNKQFNVLADNLRLKQVVINLLSNAIKYNRAGGQVKVSLHFNEATSTCSVKVSDTGVGIAAERISELFQKFNRLDNENSSIDGYGIGLLISKRLVELMGGEIQVASELGKGSCFSICLPTGFSQPEAIDSEQPQFEKTQAAIKPCKILYIEDNDVNAMVMERSLRGFPQIDYYREASGHAGLAMLKKQVFDFVLLDISIPDMNGFEIFENMKTKHNAQYRHVFAVSANAMSEDIDRGLAAGMDEYVTKPINFRALFDLIRQYQNKS